MTFSVTTDKWLATKAFINVWLRDPTYYCNNCGADYTPCCTSPRPALILRTVDDGSETKEAVVLQCKHCKSEIWQCCENPQIGNNKDHTYALIKQNKETVKNARNEFGSNEGNNMRFGLSLPPRLFQDLNKYFQTTYEKKLFNTKEELREFMKRFPAFKIAEKI